LGDKPITYERLQEELIAAARKDPKVVLTIKADKRAPFGEVVRVIDAAKTAQVGAINAMTERPSP
jgi:biopolymer transport protein ExbD